MIIIQYMGDNHDADVRVLPRLVAAGLRERLRVMPAVVVTGARQTGKTTLAQALTPGPRRYLTLDDLDVLDTARRDPQALVSGSGPVTFDEVQREPSLLLAVKRSIDRHRRPGRFVLTGSSNLLLMKRVSESLAGRASYLTLWPMTRNEQRGFGNCGAWEQLLTTPAESWPEMLAARPDDPADWRTLARSGGLPLPALHIHDADDRAIWFEAYTRAYLERDLQNLASITALPDFHRLMRAACLRLGQIVNQTSLGRDVALPQSTVHRYLNLLETSHLLVRVPAYSVNRTKRLIKSPKLYWADTATAMHLAQQNEPTGAHLENLILQDLLAWRDARRSRAEILYWRTTNGEEVDFVIETADSLLPMEIKATRRPRLRDAAHLRSFRNEYGHQTKPGLLLHTGDTTHWLTPDVLATPWWRIT